MESFFHTLKSKCRRERKLGSLAGLRSALSQNIEIFCNRRRQSSFSYLSSLHYVMSAHDERLKSHFTVCNTGSRSLRPASTSHKPQSSY